MLSTMPRLLACPYFGADIELTDEREGHILERHPDLLPEYLEFLAATISDPDEVVQGSTSGTMIFSRWYDSLYGGKYLVACGFRESGDGVETDLQI